VRTDTLAIARLRECLHYDHQTGRFTCLKSRWSTRIGKLADQTKDKNGYRLVFLDGKLRSAHRLAWAHVHGEWPETIDHKNGDCSDNRLSNLRPASRLQNQANRRTGKNNTSGYKGVHWDKNRSKWSAQIGVAGKVLYIGRYESAELAYAAYCESAKRLHGEFARLK
jgi:hypothetical protein